MNVRAPGLLSRLQAEMRSGSISDEMWELYLSRVITRNDDRLRNEDSPFVQHDIHFIVHRHRIRVLQSMENAMSQSRRLGRPLYVVQAKDEAVYPEDLKRMTDAVQRDLLQRVNPEQTRNLPSFLPLYVGMRLLLSSKDCVRFGIVKGCPCILRHIVFADDEELPFEARLGLAHPLRLMPISLILQAEGVEWKLPPTELPESLPSDTDRRGLFQLCPTYDYLRAKHEDNYFSVRRTSFMISPADTMTVYAAQGSTFEAVVADMQRPPNLDSCKHWLACYVMLSRAKSLEGLLVLRPATRSELGARPPQYLLDELDRLLELEQTSLQQLEDYIKALPIDIPGNILEILRPEAGVEQQSKVATHRSATFQGQQDYATWVPKRRLSRKTSLATPRVNASKKCKWDSSSHQDSNVQGSLLN